MKKAAFLLSLVIVGGGGIASLPTALGQQFPEGQFPEGTPLPRGPGRAGPFVEQPPYDELIDLVRKQTAAIAALAERVQQLEARLNRLDAGER